MKKAYITPQTKVTRISTDTIMTGSPLRPEDVINVGTDPVNPDIIWE